MGHGRRLVLERHRAVHPLRVRPHASVPGGRADQDGHDRGGHQTPRVSTRVPVAMAHVGRWAYALGDVEERHTQAEGSVVFRQGEPVLLRPTRTELDECQIDASGRWLLIKDNVDGDKGEDNLIVRVADESRIMLDRQARPGIRTTGSATWWRRTTGTRAQRGARVGVRRGPGAAGPRGVSRADLGWPLGSSLARQRHGRSAGDPVGGGLRGVAADAPRSNEIVAFRLDGSLDVAVLAPVMTDLDASGGGATTTPSSRRPTWTGRGSGCCGPTTRRRPARRVPGEDAG